MPTWENQGRHRYYREADLLFFEMHGEFALPDVQRMFIEVDLIVNEYGYVLLGADAHDSGSMPPEARRYLGERNRALYVDGASAVIGASFAIRTLIHLLRNAARLFGQKSSPLLFCPTTDEALAFLEVERQRCRATPAGRRQP